ncbi:MCE family protein [Nocardioides bizhenqiangii]|uniref:MCE family protein n=1 Tax=Nocardioides bizhenqiangii TaxID=3095076 RepID=A0ABZ0ZKW1_9ACTN|nr:MULTISPECIES: MCE family protein [unclassified Nocardioides]MDZ5620490.1 MCE family protein [Nocardioides sp. HM23]WQQ24858.1 MCE family protein [Nocardioides sp. HM61]
MLVNVHHDSAKEHNRLLLAGIGFLLSIALLIWLSIAIYNKEFDRVTMVTVKADRAGLQLAKFGDVRIHGALVGQVRKVTQDGNEAEIHIALDPDAAEKIPANITVEILPTTLFGQKYIAFNRPPDPSAESLSDGDVIPADRVDTNVELSQILAELFPLLRAVQPADLNATLSALATALEGRGEQIGETMDDLGVYLGAIDDHLPTLRQDLIALADVADAYDLAAPDLLNVLDNVTVTSKTITEKAEDLDVFFSDLAGLANVSTRILKSNEQNMIEVGRVTEPILALLRSYSPQFPCLIKGAAAYAPILSRTFEGNVVKQYFEFGNRQFRHFDESDFMEFGEVGHGPWCLGLPKFKVPGDRVPLDNGSDIDENPPTSPLPNFGALPEIDLTSGFAGSEGDQQVVNALLASRTGEEPDQYGALGPLLYGPVVREGRSAG